jgi:WD40 repeat protein/serine/threonine protein kinase
MSMSFGSGDYGRFDELAEEFAQRYRRGERPKLQEYIDRLPEMADEIREMFPALVEVEKVEKVDRHIRNDAIAPPVGPRFGEIGDYRIIREIGRGGMGVVYEAEQISLARHVALKVLPRHVVGDHKALERFHREAKAAARLHHTNIVPVFEVGRDGDVAFYAMQHIQGRGLDLVIDELVRLRDQSRHSDVRNLGGTVAAAGPDPRRPAAGWLTESLLNGRLMAEGEATKAADALAITGVDGRTWLDPGATSPGTPADVVPGDVYTASDYVQPTTPESRGETAVPSFESSVRRETLFRSVAQIGRQAAQGLAHAHSRGVVHRDIKPSNLLLDSAGVVWITDFGLAKAEEDGLTATGDILGTLRYMAPERFHGEGDGRADVYALGLTMYELLTLRPAFDTPDRLKLIERIKTAVPPRPRSLEPLIPRDLETIVLKAIQGDRALRYQSATDLADDLGRYLEDRPIRARRATPTEQAVRWCRRNPAVASLIAAVMLATITGTVFATFFAVRAEFERDKAVVREGEAIIARNQAEAASIQATAARRAAEQSSEEARKRLTRLYVFTGNRYLDDRETFASLLWFHRAWEQDHAEVSADASHRARIAGALSEIPELLGACFHDATVCDGVFSPDGRRVLTRTDGNLAYLWDYEQSRQSTPPLVHTARVRHICFSPDGASVATASADGTACVWDSATGAKRFTLKHDGPLTWVAFHPDGKRLATAAEDRTVRMWSAVDGKPIDWRLPGNTVIDHLAFAPDRSRLLTAGRDQIVRVWDLDPPRAISPPITYRQPTDTERYRFNQDSWPRFAPRGQAVLSSDGKGLEVWPGGEKDNVQRIPFGSRSWVVETYFIPNSNRALVTGNSSVASVVDLSTGKVVFELAHPREANLGAVSPDGKWLLTCSSGGLVTLWDAATGKRAAPGQRCGDFCSGVVFSPDGSRYMATSQDGTARIWATGSRTASSRPYRYDCGRANLVVAVMKDDSTLRSYSPDGQRWVEWTKDGKAWYGSGPNTPPRPIPHPGPVDAARFCDDGSRLVVAGGQAIRSWRADTVIPAGPVVAAATLIDPLWRWNHVTTGRPSVLAAIPADPRENTRLPTELLRPVQLSRDGNRIVCVDDEKTVSVWDLTVGRRVFGPARHPDPGPRVFEEPSHLGWVSDAVLSRDGLRLAVAIDTTGTLTVWDVETGKILHHNRRFRGYIRKLQFSDDGRRVMLFSSDGLARMYDAGTGVPLGPAVSQPGVQLAVGVSPDGRRLAVYDDRANVFKVYDVERGERVLTIPYGDRRWPTALWFDSAGRSLNAVLGGDALTFPLPRFEVPFAECKGLLQFLTGQQIDATEGIEFVEQTTFRRAPDRYRDVFQNWKTSSADVR